MSNNLIKAMAVIFGIFIIIVIIMADTRHLGFIYALYDFPLGDKVGHFILFGILSFLINLSIKSKVSSVDGIPKSTHDETRSVIETSLLLALFVGLEEFSQRWFPSRTSDLLDLAASYLGISLFALLAWKLKTRRSPFKRPSR
jgi:polysaccharide biosynthesis protein VpsQ